MLIPGWRQRRRSSGLSCARGRLACFTARPGKRRLATAASVATDLGQDERLRVLRDGMITNAFLIAKAFWCYGARKPLRSCRAGGVPGAARVTVVSLRCVVGYGGWSPVRRLRRDDSRV